MYIHIVGQFAIKPAYTILNSCNLFIHMTDMYLTIQIQHDTVVYLNLSVHPKGESTALRRFIREIDTPERSHLTCIHRNPIMGCI
jgi:hypothetical protein